MADNQTNIATHLARVQTDRNTIRAKLVELGIADNTANLDTLAAAIAGIEDRGAVSASVREGDTYTIPKGYHNGSGTVSGVAGGGNYKLQSKVVTPTKNQQNITPDDGFYGFSDVTVKAIPEIYQDVSSVTATAAQVLTGHMFVASDGTLTPGTMINNGTVTRVLDTATTNFTIPQGFHDGKGSVSIVNEEKSVTPTKAQQTIVPTSGKVLSKLVVGAIPANYTDSSDADAVAANLLAGKTMYVNNVKVEGTMTDNGAIALTIDGMTATSATIPAGYTSGGSVSLTDDIERALAAI